MVKLIVFAKRKAGMSFEEFDRYWLENHAKVVQSVPEFMRHVRKYTQCHLAKGSGPAGPVAAAEFDGVAELWFDSVEAADLAFKEPRYLEIVRPDELKFVDLTASIGVITNEVPIYPK